MDSHQLRLILIPLLVVISTPTNSNPACPNYVPPNTSPLHYTATGGFVGSISGIIYADSSSACAAALLSYNTAYGSSRTLASVTQTGNGFNCNYSNGAYTGFIYACPVGYNLTYSGGQYNCGLTNPNIVTCPPNNCTQGLFVGMGRLKVNRLDYQNTGVACFNGCNVYTKETMAIWGLKPAGSSETLQDLIGDFYQTSEQCSASVDGTLEKYSESQPNKPQVPSKTPGEFTAPKENCITDAAGSQVCIDRQRPGCGIVDNKSFCSDDILQKPGVGLCTFVGSTGYVCAMGLDKSIKPPKITGEPDPIPTLDLQLPVQKTTGDPPTTIPIKGLNPSVPNSGFNLEDTIPAQLGYYPGPSGNGSGNNDKADETNTPSSAQCVQFPNSIGCQNSADYWGQFAKYSNNSTAVVDELKKTNEALNKTPTQGLTSQSVTNQFTPESITSSNNCPAPKTFTAGGQTYALSYEPICSLATGVRPVFLAVMALFAAYIVLGATS